MKSKLDFNWTTKAKCLEWITIQPFWMICNLIDIRRHYVNKINPVHRCFMLTAEVKIYRSAQILNSAQCLVSIAKMAQVFSALHFSHRKRRSCVRTTDGIKFLDRGLYYCNSQTVNMLLKGRNFTQDPWILYYDVRQHKRNWSQNASAYNSPLNCLHLIW